MFLTNQVDFSEEQTFDTDFSSAQIHQLDQGGQQLDEGNQVFVGAQDVILSSAAAADDLQDAELFVQDGPGMKESSIKT